MGESGARWMHRLQQLLTQTLLDPHRRKKLTINPVNSTLCTEVSPSVAGPSSTSVAGPSSTSPAASPASSSLGYIRVATFNGNTTEAFRLALLSLKEQGAGRLLLDLRNNSGGLFPAGVQVGKPCYLRT